MKQLMPFIVVIVFFILIAIFILALYNYRLKKRIIDAGPLDEIGLRFLQQLSDSRTEAMKWAIILSTTGLGLIVMQFIPYSAADSPLPYGVEMLFVALGFFLYHLFIRNHQDKQSR
jgi:peptidoglycan/LPS O-acetylase OafA/YrhL